MKFIHPILLAAALISVAGCGGMSATKFVHPDFDFAFIDADKQAYAGYFEQCLELGRLLGAIARQEHPQVLYGRPMAAVVEIDDVQLVLAHQDVAGIVVAQVQERILDYIAAPIPTDFRLREDEQTALFRDRAGPDRSCGLG